MFYFIVEHGPGIDIFTPGKPGEYDLEGGIWEDEDARNFYENLIDLKAFVPAILFKDNEKSQNKDANKDDSKGKLFFQMLLILLLCIFSECQGLGVVHGDQRRTLQLVLSFCLHVDSRNQTWFSGLQGTYFTHLAILPSFQRQILKETPDITYD